MLPYLKHYLRSLLRLQVISLGPLGLAYDRTANSSTLYLHTQGGASPSGGASFGSAAVLLNALQVWGLPFGDRACMQLILGNALGNGLDGFGELLLASLLSPSRERCWRPSLQGHALHQCAHCGHVTQCACLHYCRLQHQRKYPLPTSLSVLP